MNPLQPSSQELLESREFRRLLWVSLACHLGLVTAFWLGGQLRWPTPTPNAPVFVDIIAPAPAPAPAPAAKPAPAREKPVVIPKRARPKPKPEPKVVAKVEPKPKPKPEPKVEPKAEPAPEAPSAAELLAKIRDRVDSSAPATGKTAAAGGVFNPQLAAYQRDIKVLLNSSWIGAGQFRTQPELASTYAVNIDDAGKLRDVQLTASSGNRFYDESTERAIYRAAPFPPPPGGAKTLEVHFRPSGVF